ncbi:MAG: hypothetical protein M3349_04685 [Actinomycetota bacterium]|nr:hypothetical protein [Actinomycetota bacterium]
MSQGRRRTDIIADPSFVAGLADVDTATLRARRQLCLAVERELSYQRRMLHGRLDLIGYEQRRRRGEAEGSPIDSLGEILQDATSGGGSGRAAPDTLIADPVVHPGPGRRPIDRVLDADTLGRLESASDDELVAARTAAEVQERAISDQRLTTHRVEALLAAELAERYRTGSISTDELITG